MKPLIMNIGLVDNQSEKTLQTLYGQMVEATVSKPHTAYAKGLYDAFLRALDRRALRANLLDETWCIWDHTARAKVKGQNK